MRYLIGGTIFIALVFSSCRNNKKEENEKKETANPKFKNGIVVTGRNINIEKAFLAFDNGDTIPDNNTVKMNQKIWLRLVTSGWKLKDSLSFLSGRETVETNTGVVFLDDKDLFKESANGIFNGGSQTIGMSLLITELKREVDYFKVSFKIKDEIEPRNALEGYYKLHVR